MAAYSAALLDEIRSAIDVVDLVGRFVNLKKAGVNWKGLCPFHAEKTPSFMVNPAKGIFHCFGCGVGGDAFGFLMRQDRVTFPEAVRALAKTAGVALPEDTRQAGHGDGKREELHRVMDLASRFYAEGLWKPGGARARTYLEGRGIDSEVARRFALGYAPDAWDALGEFMKSQHVADETLVQAGLVVPRPSGSGFYDRFRARLLFAIRDLQGRVVAFGGRAFGDEQPKYLNSPETPLYTKGNLLYAADLARETIRVKNRALLVEGYVDCLMAHQHGFTETVAALGTAFTGAQLGLLRRYCEEVITFFDADAAGRKAAERAEELLEPTAGGMAWGVNRSGEFATPALRVKVALLPTGHDPDTFLRAEGAGPFAERIAAARSLLAYAFERAVTDPEGGSGPRARTSAFARVALMLAKVGDAEEATALSREAALRLGVDPTQLWIEAQKLQTALRRRTATPAAALAPAAPVARERDLVALLLASGDARETLLPLVEDEDLRHEHARAIVTALRSRPDAPPETLFAEVTEEGARSLLAALLVEERPLEDARVAVAQFVAHLAREHHIRRQRKIASGISETQVAAGAAAAPVAEFVALHEASKIVYELGGGVAQSLEPRAPEGPQGVQTNE